MTKIDIINSDVIKWAEEYQGEPFHAAFCDPPYHLIAQHKRWGNATTLGKTQGIFARHAKGFLQTGWDGTDESGQGIAFNPETWAALSQHLYPGTFGFAYASSRGWHRLAVAIEDAGNIIQPAIWIYGYSVGFPKSTRIDTQIDRQNGNIRADKLNGGHIGMGKAAGDLDNENELKNRVPHTIGKGNYTNGTPIDDLAKTWQDHRYGGQILSPSAEPIICFQKPYDGRPLDCIVSTGAGALNVGAGRIPAKEITGLGGHPSRGYSGGLDSLEPNGRPVNGRWPKNLLLQHLETCTRVNGEWQCSPECVVRQMGEEYGNAPSGSVNGKRKERISFGENGTFAERERDTGYYREESEGPITRYFYQPHFSYEVFEQLSTGKQVLYVVKPGEAEREAGLNGHKKTTRNRVNAGGLENEPRFAPVTKANNHPTLKSIAASKYLASLLLPPPEYAPRRIIIPFCGSGSEIIGAMLAGWDEIIGIEQSLEYCAIAGIRTAWWKSKMEETGGDVDKIIDVWHKEERAREDGQLSLF